MLLRLLQVRRFSAPEASPASGLLQASSTFEEWLNSARNRIKPVSSMDLTVLSAMPPCMIRL